MQLRYRLTCFALTAAAVVALTGCASHPRYYAAGPPPPPVYGPSPLVQMADSNGLRDGRANGERDLYQNRGYAPRRDGAFKGTPGYDGRFGPFPVYRDNYRAAYLRGYDEGFRRAETGR